MFQYVFKNILKNLKNTIELKMIFLIGIKAFRSYRTSSFILLIKYGQAKPTIFNNNNNNNKPQTNTDMTNPTKNVKLIKT